MSSSHSSQRVRLYQKATVLGYRRSKVKQRPHTSLLRIDGVTDRAAVDFYLGKRVAYIYHVKSRSEDDDNKPRVIWGRVTQPHGNGGVVRAKFAKNLPPKSFGQTARVMLYPSRI